MPISFKLEGFHTQKTINRILDKEFMSYFSNEVARRMDKYVPMQEGMLAQNTVIKPESITFLSPYSHYQYQGKNFNYSREMHPLATSHWDEVMIKIEGKDLSRDLSKYLEDK